MEQNWVKPLPYLIQLLIIPRELWQNPSRVDNITW